MLSVKQGGIKYHFKVFGRTRPGIEPRSPGPLVNISESGFLPVFYTKGARIFDVFCVLE